jgi:restriction system protein
MQGPKFLRFVSTVLDVLNEIGGSGRAAEVTDLVIERLAIPDEELAATLKSGASRVRNEIAWARQYLVNDGLIDWRKYGTWQLTDEALGRKLDDDEVFTLYKRVQAVHSERARAKKAVRAVVNEVGESEDEEAAPPTLSGSTDAREELLQLLRQLPPDGFERLCQRLLREAGFERVVVTGQSRDGGIDGHGLLQVNPLVSFKVLFQCKRYTGSVTPSHVRDFRGAMAGRADKGLILTTGSFTAEARAEAHRDGVPSIELVDADQLLDMFEKYELGVRETKVYVLDREFFVAFGADAG